MIRTTRYSWPGVHEWRTYVVTIGLLVAFTAAVSSTYSLGITADWLLLAMLGTGFYLMFGLGGQFAFSQPAFYAIGAYTSAYVAQDRTFWIGLVAGVLVGAAVALVFSLAMLRASHWYFAIATLALNVAMTVVVREWSVLGNGGDRYGIRPPSVLGYELTSPREQVWLLVAGLAVALGLVTMIERSPLRREFLALRDKPTVAKTTGIPTWTLQVVIFVLGSTLAAGAGSLYAHTRGSLTLDTFNLELGISIFLVVLLGGTRSVWGVLLGSAFVVWVPTRLHTIGEYQELIFGALLIVVIVAVPDGLVGIWRSVRTFVARRWRTGHGAAPPGGETGEASTGVATDAAAGPAADEHERAPVAVGEGPPILEARDVTVRFGGVAALTDAGFTVRPGEVLGIVGPNGSGKSTLLNAVTGLVAAQGTLRIADAHVELGGPHAIRQAGLLRTFQTPQTFTALSRAENVMLASSDHADRSLFSVIFRRRRMVATDARRLDGADAAMRRSGVRPAPGTATGLAFGEQRLLELARAIGADPRVVLLDEPSAGLNSAETDQLRHVLEGLRDDGVALVVVDHKVDFLDRLCDRILVLQLGRVIAEGVPGEVWSNQAVVDAYLGTAVSTVGTGTDGAASTTTQETAP